MSQYPILQTKLYIPPTRPELVSRPRLIERLNAGLTTRGAFARALTLICAPAGFGKTTLVSAWIQDLGRTIPPVAIAWLSLDESDNDPTRFLAYLIAALQTTEAGIGGGVLSALQSPQPPPVEAVLISLINEVASIPDRIVLVLDDHHLINTQPIYDALAFLLEHLPPRMHLVIASREDPHMPLARLRARGQLTELRATDLRFTSSESAEFLNQAMDLNLSAEDITALERRTEGWIAGLQLAAISMQGHKEPSAFVKSFTGSHRFVLDYLLEEVLEQQSERVQTFLLQTAILDRLSGSLCDAVRCGGATSPSTPEGDAVPFGDTEARTGQGDSQATLERLERANLFIVPLDEERRWYRYHHLFADLLRQRQRQTQPEQVPTLHRRASEWYERNGFLDEAIEHALRAADLGRAAYLIEEHVDTAWQRGEHTRLRRWLAGLPVELIFSRPHLCIPHAWDLFTSGQHDAAEQSLQAAERALDPRTTEPSPPERAPLSDADRRQIQGRVAAIRAFLASYRGDLPGTIRQAGRALAHLPEQDTNWRSTAAIALGDAHSLRGELPAAYRARWQALEASKAGGNISMIANLKLADTYRQQGKLRQTVEICRQQWELAQELGLSETVVAGWLLAIWGETLAELNDLEGALRQTRQGVKRTERGKDVMVIGWSNLCLIRVLFSTSDFTSANRAIHKMEAVARKHDLPPFITHPMAAWQARIWLAQGNLEGAAQWAAERGLTTDGGPTLLREMEYLALARILIAQGRLAETAGLLQRLLETAETGGHTSRTIEILMLQALASQAGGQPDRAMTRLEQALTLAEPGGFVRVFVDEGPPMARLLYRAATHRMESDYARRLLAAFSSVEVKQTEPSSTQLSGSELVEPLSERELEVLQLLAKGLNNREVAARLFLSLNTVKTHNRNIYGKLGVRSRTQAVARARTLGILPTT
jgi:LuxR family maltose regulon positive regulatory protein